MNKMFFSVIFSAALLTNVCGQSAYADSPSISQFFSQSFEDGHREPYNHSSDLLAAAHTDRLKGPDLNLYNAEESFNEAAALMIISKQNSQFISMKASELLIIAARKGYLPAIKEMANILSGGYWIGFNETEPSLAWYEKAAAQGDLYSYHRLVNLFLDEKDFFSAFMNHALMQSLNPNGVEEGIAMATKHHMECTFSNPVTQEINGFKVTIVFPMPK